MAKGTRITLTKRQAESSTGTRLIDMIVSMCHDGELEIQEIDELHILLRSDESDIAAVPFLRAITREAVADGVIDEHEAYRLKRAFERVVPKEVRGIVSTHLEDIGLPARSERETAPAWTRHEATAKQIDYIVALGGTPTSGITKGEASDLIEELLERRPPTPRQVMLLRFFDRMDLQNSMKEEVSGWIDDLFFGSMHHELAWDRFKLETGHDPRSQDPSVVPIGAFRRYIRQEASTSGRPSPKRSGCMPILITLFGLGVLVVANVLDRWG